jgi:hypothetical protein
MKADGIPGKVAGFTWFRIWNPRVISPGKIMENSRQEKLSEQKIKA